MTDRPLEVIEAEREREPQYMDDGSVDWAWFHREKARREELMERQICADCGFRPFGCSDYCDDPEHPNGESCPRLVACGEEDCREHRWKRRYFTCAFCGRKNRWIGGGGSQWDPMTIDYCEPCDQAGRTNIPPAEESIGQGALF